MKISHIFSSIVAFWNEVFFLKKTTIEKQNGIQSNVTVDGASTDDLIPFYGLR